jgi:hypothetical protein
MSSSQGFPNLNLGVSLQGLVQQNIPLSILAVFGCWYLLTRTEKIHKRTDTIVAFTRRALNIVSTGKHVSQLRVLT